jgi:hypothetical protein
MDFEGRQESNQLAAWQPVQAVRSKIAVGKELNEPFDAEYASQIFSGAAKGSMTAKGIGYNVLGLPV